MPGFPNILSAGSAAYQSIEAAKALTGYDTVAALDSFDRADGAIGTPDVGSAWAALVGSAYVITSNEAQATTTGVQVATIDTSEGDVVIEGSIECPATAADGGFALRATAGGDFLVVKVYQSGVRLFKSVSGTETQLVAYSSTSRGGHHVRVRIVADGAAISVYNALTGVQIGSTHTLTGGDETTFSNTNTRHGLYDKSTSYPSRNSRWDNLVIRRLR